MHRMEGVPTPFALKLPRSDPGGLSCARAGEGANVRQQRANEEAPAWILPSQARPRAPSHSLLVFAQSSCQHFLEAQGIPLLLPGDTLRECLNKKRWFDKAFSP